VSKIYSVDAAIRDKLPLVELRGRLYRLRDFTIAERLERALAFKEEQEAAEKAAEEAGEVFDFEKLRDIAARVIQEAVVGVPDDVAKTVTELEFEIFKQAVVEARSDVLGPVVRNATQADLERVGRADG